MLEETADRDYALISVLEDVKLGAASWIKAISSSKILQSLHVPKMRRHIHARKLMELFLFDFPLNSPLLRGFANIMGFARSIHLTLGRCLSLFARFSAEVVQASNLCTPNLKHLALWIDTSIEQRLPLPKS